ncbi:tryptophan halogenase family protein [Pseudoalteromonas rubra]|uniref:tryptophan halogenase family protein n=1 Tax=Pseudoalteromonas rubra TaxID=43658 RepID=UPI0005FA0A2D|nr:tryptophan halogenase family protein [Pseudoalteromonas rubra]
MQSIIIVGGGTAGWLTAVMLNHSYNKLGQQVEIHVIESPEVDIVGVGEATVPAIKDFLQAVGISEYEFLRHTNATIKNGILFRNWRTAKNGRTHEYLHPFEQQRIEKRLDISTSWLLSERELPYDQSVSLVSALVSQELAPKTLSGKEYEGLFRYSYHLDARLFGHYLRNFAQARGVKRTEAHVSKVVTEQGKIVRLETEHGSFQADLFVDCSGFKGLLINEVEPQGNWMSYRDSLLCDKAVTVQQPHEPRYKPKPYTVSEALSSGWAWRIDLQNRQGAGYVYSSRHLDKTEAEKEFRAYLGLPPEVTVRHLDMQIGRRKQQWVGNCVAVGLSSGFIEPLESTGIHLIYLAARAIALHHNFSHTNQVIRDNFNRQMGQTYDELRDFIVMHYVLSDREDSPFWRDVKGTLAHTPSLKAQLELWRYKVCEYFDVCNSASHMFSDASYRYILYGMEYYPKLNLPSRAGEFTDVFAQIAKWQKEVTRVAIRHTDFLDTLQSNGNLVTVKMK